AVYELQVRRFDPDMVVVSFIMDDLMRKFIYRRIVAVPTSGDDYQTAVNCTSLPATIDNPDCRFNTLIFMNRRATAEPGEARGMMQQVYRSAIDRLPWTSPYPELFARTLGKRFGLEPRLTPYRRHNLYDNVEAGIDASIAALQTIRAAHPNVLVLHN